MKKLLAVAIFVLVAAIPGWADFIEWRGEFTYDIEELYTFSGGVTVPGVPGLQVGDTFCGYYRYVSPIVDGTFGLPEGTQGYFNPRPLSEFGIFVPSPIAFNPSPGQPGQLYQWFNSTVPGPIITVLGGSVIDFYLMQEIGPVGFTFDLNTFHLVNTSNSDQGYNARGDVHFGSPTRAVPEPATIVLLGAGLVGLAGYSRRKFRSN